MPKSLALWFLIAAMKGLKPIFGMVVAAEYVWEQHARKGTYFPLQFHVWRKSAYYVLALTA